MRAPITYASAFAIIASAVLVAPAATAKDPAPLPTVYNDVVACRDIADSAQRLACYDAAVARLDEAQRNDQLVVMGSEDVKATRRGLFGFSLPKIKLFGGGDEDEIKEVVSTIASFSGGTGAWVLTLEDGAVWAQTDGIFVKRPEVGKEIKIERGAFGSYFARIDGGVAFRVKRRS